ncbi:DUF554 domain-containing protein [Corticimicrobacter populi]|uniref:DUF554 domain-containing protein n=1 Tax=Corticimicrobacter populi TaxID=2175229 RepID=A0A2V1JYB8_9BURK|nr:DUF554 domain-containing protein [Corticimicrobacter populi]PWF22102.1 hypothetical protein DD235_12000 [Corticimicrobacter populi]
MVIGPFINSAAILLGGIGGAALGDRIPASLRKTLPSVFGLAALGMGVMLTVRTAHLPVAVMALLLGAVIGELCRLEYWIGRVGNAVRLLVERRSGTGQAAPADEEAFLDRYVVVVVLFCASGAGVFGSMQEGMTGDASVLLAKAFLDLFTAAIFASSLGYAVAVIAAPQLAIQLMLALAAGFLMPLTDAGMQADFSGTGGLLLLATGFRICGMLNLPVANLLPALVLAMPLSALWSRFF